MASLIEAIDIKRKMFFEYEGAPFHCVDVEVSKPTARGGQTLVRLKMRNLLTRAVFDRTFKAGDKFKEPDLVVESATYLYADGSGFNFMHQETFETLTLSADVVGEDVGLLADNVNVEIQKFNGRPIGLQLPPHVELTVTHTEPGVTVQFYRVPTFESAGGRALAELARLDRWARQEVARWTPRNPT